MEIAAGLALLLIVLYIAYKLGKFVIKVVLGLALMALVAGLVWQQCGGQRENTSSISGMKDRIADLYQSMTSAPHGEELMREVRAFNEQAQKLGREKLAEFKEKQLPAIKEKARKYKEELDRQGKLKEAQEFWERFTKWIEDPEHRTLPGLKN
jgi:hypothetical protein